MSKFVRFVCDKCGADSNETDRLEFHSVLIKSKPELTFYCHHDHYELERTIYLCDDCLRNLDRLFLDKKVLESLPI